MISTSGRPGVGGEAAPSHKYSRLLLWVIPAIVALVPFLAVLAIPAFVVIYGVRAHDIIALMVSYCLVMLGTTLGYHRLLAHKSLKLAPSVRYPLIVLGAMAAQGPPGFWVAHHRAHHGDPDGPLDPHSPAAVGSAGTDGVSRFLHAHIGWMFGIGGRYDGRFVRDIRRDPATLMVEKHYFKWVIAGLLLPAVAVLPLHGTNFGFLQSIYWAGLVRLGFSHQATWLVNSACHLWGYRNFETPDSSRNNWFVAALTLGEGWHNNHHADPARACHGVGKWDFDPTFTTASFLEVMGLARDFAPPIATH